MMTDGTGLTLSNSTYVPSNIEKHCISLYCALMDKPDKVTLMNNCIADRLTAIYNVNDSYLDKSLKSMYNDISFNLTNPEAFAPVKHTLNTLNHALTINHLALSTVINKFQQLPQGGQN